MPNGGVMPSCFICKWAKKDDSKPIHPVENNPLKDPIECQQHGFKVWLPSSHVCANLGYPYDESGLSTFAKDVGLESNIIYAWFQFQYRTQESPTIPQHHHELIKLAGFQEFSKWTIEDKEKVFRHRRNKKQQELTNSSDEGAA
jgi:hypothetical protein